MSLNSPPNPPIDSGIKKTLDVDKERGILASLNVKRTKAGVPAAKYYAAIDALNAYEGSTDSKKKAELQKKYESAYEDFAVDKVEGGPAAKVEEDKASQDVQVISAAAEGKIESAEQPQDSKNAEAAEENEYDRARKIAKDRFMWLGEDVRAMGIQVHDVPVEWGKAYDAYKRITSLVTQMEKEPSKRIIEKINDEYDALSDEFDQKIIPEVLEAAQKVAEAKKAEAPAEVVTENQPVEVEPAEPEVLAVDAEPVAESLTVPEFLPGQFEAYQQAMDKALGEQLPQPKMFDSRDEAKKKLAELLQQASLSSPVQQDPNYPQQFPGVSPLNSSPVDYRSVNEGGFTKIDAAPAPASTPEALAETETPAAGVEPEPVLEEKPMPHNPYLMAAAMGYKNVKAYEKAMAKRDAKAGRTPAPVSGDTNPHLLAASHGMSLKQYEKFLEKQNAKGTKPPSEAKKNSKKKAGLIGLGAAGIAGLAAFFGLSHPGNDHTKEIQKQTTKPAAAKSAASAGIKAPVAKSSAEAPPKVVVNKEAAKKEVKTAPKKYKMSAKMDVTPDPANSFNIWHSTKEIPPGFEREQYNQTQEKMVRDVGYKSKAYEAFIKNKPPLEQKAKVTEAKPEAAPAAVSATVTEEKAQPEASSETVRNAQGIEVNPNEPHVYSDTKGNLFVHGGTYKERSLFAQTYSFDNPGIGVYTLSENTMEENGVSYYVTEGQVYNPDTKLREISTFSGRPKVDLFTKQVK
ncbi:MAG: hypothetical protein JWN64_246 [Parcubacteria group bacterium]|nr:hypothetical protein [Parcubacteria group bacterium]